MKAGEIKPNLYIPLKDPSILTQKEKILPSIPKENVVKEESLKDSLKINKDISDKKPESFNPDNKPSFKFPPKNTQYEGGSSGNWGDQTQSDKGISKYHAKVDSFPTLVKDKMKEKIDISTRESRIQASNDTTQFDDTYDFDSNENGCAASCVVNAAMIEGGKEGISNLIEVINERGSKSYEKQFKGLNGYKEIPGWDKLPGIEERAKNNTLTRKDLLDLQTIVYSQMRKIEGGSNATLNIKTIKTYINTDTKTNPFAKDQEPLKKHFSNCNVKLVDTDGDTKNAEFSGHYVLFFNNEGSKGAENKVFDPWPKKEGNQVTDISQEYHSVVEAYH